MVYLPAPPAPPPPTPSDPQGEFLKTMFYLKSIILQVFCSRSGDGGVTE